VEKKWAPKFYQILKNSFSNLFMGPTLDCKKNTIDDTVPILKYLINWFVCGLFK